MFEYTETAEAITRFLFIGEKAENLKPVELVISLGNDDITGTAAELLRLKECGVIREDTFMILSGNVGSINKGKAPEAERLYAEAVSLGFPADRLIKEPNATNALQNMQFSKPLAEAIKPLEEFDGILLIGKAFLMRRAKMCADACGYPMDKLSYYGTVDLKDKNIGPDTWWQTEAARERTIKEIGRIAEYSLKGDLKY